MTTEKTITFVTKNGKEIAVNIKHTWEGIILSTSLSNDTQYGLSGCAAAHKAMGAVSSIGSLLLTAEKDAIVRAAIDQVTAEYTPDSDDMLKIIDRDHADALHEDYCRHLDNMDKAMGY